MEISLIYMSLTARKTHRFGQTFFFAAPHLQRSRSGCSPCSTLDVCSDAAQQKLLTQRSKNIGRDKERLSSQQPRPESCKHLTNPDVKSKLHRLPERSYVTASPGQFAHTTGPNIWFVFSNLFPHAVLNDRFILSELYTGEGQRKCKEASQR